MFRNRNRQLTAKLEQEFSRFGSTVCRSIVMETQKSGGLRGLLERLEIQTAPEDDVQIRALNQYIDRYGVNAFLEKMILNLQRENLTLNRGLGEGDRGPETPVRNQVSGASAQETPWKSEPAVFDASGRYIGPERRSGEERRSGRDRRRELDAVSRNYRYGGERRKAIRRAEDRLKDPRELGMD